MEFSSIRSRSNRTDHGMRFYKWFIDWFACFSALIINHSVFEIIRTPLFSQQRQPSARQTINSCVRQNVQIKNQFQLELFIVNIDRAIDRQTLLLFTFNALLLWFFLWYSNESLRAGCVRCATASAGMTHTIIDHSPNFSLRVILRSVGPPFID